MRAFPDDAKITWAEGKIGARGSAALTHQQRALLRTWIQGKIHKSYADVAGLSMGDLSTAYNDPSDKVLLALAARVETKAALPVAVAVEVVKVVAADDGPIPAPVELVKNGRHGPENADEVAGAIAAALAGLRIKAGLDEGRVRAIAAEEAGKVASPERVIVVREGKEPARVDLGVQHFKFPLLLRVLETGMHAYLVGPAGTGKTTAAHQAEKALTLGRYECQSFYGTMTATTLLGYKDANGNYHDTPLRRAYESGGLWCADEVDAGNANGTVVLNSALANGVCSFADKMVVRHAGFRCVACANTVGQGASRQYVGRNQIDAATLDRFCFIDWPIDEGLESALLGVKGPQETLRLDEGGILSAQDWLSRVRAVRAAVDALAVRHLVTPRAALFGVALFAAGIGRKHIEEMVLWRGLDSEQRARVEAKAGK